MCQLYHFCTEMRERFDELGEIRHSFNATKTSNNLRMDKEQHRDNWRRQMNLLGVDNIQYFTKLSILDVCQMMVARVLASKDAC